MNGLQRKSSQCWLPLCGLCGLHSQSSVQRVSSLVQQPVFQLLTPLSMVCCVKVRFLVELSKLFGVNMVCLVGSIRCDLRPIETSCRWLHLQVVPLEGLDCLNLLSQDNWTRVRVQLSFHNYWRLCPTDPVRRSRPKLPFQKSWGSSAVCRPACAYLYQ